uniref:WD repeat-containing protein 38 n=1 Tax=Phallusia mammillata TaxID=59560 RepID=A0A6F9DX37_9ASCI|nr:WD repeat-containing protein 38 [Phallusia mammillata]
MFSSTPPQTRLHDDFGHIEGHAIVAKGLVTEICEKPPKAPSIEGSIKILKTIDVNCDAMCCKFSENCEKFAVGLANGDVKIYKASSGSSIYHLADEDTKSDRLPVTSVNFIPADVSTRGEMLIATYAGGMMKFWHVATCTCLQSIHEPRQILAASVCPSVSCIVTAGSTEQINIYDVETGQKTRVCEPSPNRLVMDGHRFRVFALKHHPLDDHTFLSGGWDDTIQVWDQREDHAIRRIYGPHICGDGIDINKKYNHILTASWRKDNVLQVWDLKSGTKLKTIPPDFSGDSMLYCCQWLGMEHMICGGTEKNMIRIVDKTTLATSGIVSDLPKGIYSVDHDRVRLASHPHSDATLIVATAGNQIYMLSNAPVRGSSSV